MKHHPKIVKTATKTLKVFKILKYSVSYLFIYRFHFLGMNENLFGCFKLENIPP